jgi:hypothetical protein
LTSGQLTVSNCVTILGPGAAILTLSGNNASRVFHVTGTNVTIRGFKIANGQGALYGAGIRTGGRAVSAVAVSDCVITNNTTTLLGAGIFNSPGVTLAISNCTISGNSATSGNGGGIYKNNATLTVVASTLSGNFAYYVGGGIMNYGQPGSAILTLTASTLSSNSASYGATILSDGYQGVAAVQIGDTILNGGAGANISNGSGTITFAGFNLSSYDGGGLLTATGDQTNTAPLLGPLQDNGGPTWTHALLRNSPAIVRGKRDAIPALARATGQRGSLRMVDFPAVTNAAGSEASDIGVFEVPCVPASPTFSTACTFSTFVGWNRAGSEDGVGDNARFQYPQGVAVDSAGCLYVADLFSDIVRKLAPLGTNWRVSTLAGPGGANGANEGTGSGARFWQPRGLAVDSTGNVYVTDYANQPHHSADGGQPFSSYLMMLLESRCRHACPEISLLRYTIPGYSAAMLSPPDQAQG